MKVLSIQLRFCKLTLIAFFLAAPALQAQSSAAHVEAASDEQHLRSRLFIYDLHDGSSRLIYTADSIWEAPNWSPDGKYLIANSGGGIYKLALKQDGTAEPQRLAPPTYGIATAAVKLVLWTCLSRKTSPSVLTMIRN